MKQKYQFLKMFGKEHTQSIKEVYEFCFNEFASEMLI